jgi:hypothetical protein
MVCLNSLLVGIQSFAVIVYDLLLEQVSLTPCLGFASKTI